MTIEEAKNYINEGIKEGYWDEDLFEHMTDNALIEFAEYNSERGDAEL